MSWGGVMRLREEKRVTAVLEALLVKVNAIFFSLRQLRVGWGVDMVPEVLNIKFSRKKSQVHKLILKKSRSYRISAL